jgi:hypothetical protein
VPAPDTDPDRRDPRAVADVAAYVPHAPVWVWAYRCGSWRPGIILQASARAAMVRYRPAQGRGTTVDTAAAYLAPAANPTRTSTGPARRATDDTR